MKDKAYNEEIGEAMGRYLRSRGLASVVTRSRNPPPAPEVLPPWLMATFYFLITTATAWEIWGMLS